MSLNRGRGPEVPKSQEELDQEAEDAAVEQAAELRKTRERARLQGKIFLMCAVACALFGSGLAWVLADPPFAWGVTAGSATMVLNLALLTMLLEKLLLGEEYRGFYAVALVSTFGLLLMATGIVIRRYPDSAMGFGIGLTVPVVAGLMLGLFRRAGKSD